MKIIEDHYNKYHKVWRKRAGYYLRATDQDAEDVVQEAYLRALKYYKPDNPPLVFESWFVRIFFNCVNDQRRIINNTPPSVELEEEHEEGIPCNQYSEEAVKQIYELIAQKSDIVRERLYLHFKYGYSSADIHAICGGAAITARKLLSDFRKELREKFGE